MLDGELVVCRALLGCIDDVEMGLTSSIFGCVQDSLLLFILLRILSLVDSLRVYSLPAVSSGPSVTSIAALILFDDLLLQF